MRCRDCEQYLPDFVTNALPKAEMQVVREHLKTCPRCRKEQENLHNAFVLLDDAKQFERASTPAINLLPGIHARISARKRIRTPWVSVPRIARYAAIPLAVLIFALYLLIPTRFDGKDEQIFTEREKESLLRGIDAESLSIEELLAIGGTSFEEISSSSIPDLPDDAFANAQESLIPISESDALSYALITADPEDVLESLPSEVSEKILEDFEKHSML